MKNTKSSHTADYLKSVREVIETKPADLHAEILKLARTYGGDENRFIRQELIEDLIGIKHPIVKCGIGMLAAFTMTYLNNLKAETTPAPAPEPEGIKGIDYPMDEQPEGIVTKSEPAPEPIKKATIGMAVIRKQCQRKGEVTAIEGQHVTVTLEDGSKRKPCMSRFIKLYTQAI